MAKNRKKKHPPKGAYPVPGAGYATEHKAVDPRGRSYSVVAVRKKHINLRQFALVLIEMAEEEIRAEQRANRMSSD